MDDNLCDSESDDESEPSRPSRLARLTGETVVLAAKGGTALVETGVILCLAVQGSLRMNATLAVLALARAALTMQETARRLWRPQR